MLAAPSGAERGAAPLTTAATGPGGFSRLCPMAVYAAYGSNLSPDRMAQRAPHSPLRGSGWLTDWRLTFGGGDLSWEGPLCSLVEDPGHQVYVALYDLTPADEKSLDQWEGVDIGLWTKIRVRVNTLDGDVIAWVYVLNAYEGGLPTARYLGMLAEAAEAGGAPDDYVAELRRRPCTADNAAGTAGGPADGTTGGTAAGATDGPADTDQES